MDDLAHDIQVATFSAGSCRATSPPHSVFAFLLRFPAGQLLYPRLQSWHWLRCVPRHHRLRRHLLKRQDPGHLDHDPIQDNSASGEMRADLGDLV